jgi:hypothetical protein
MQMPARVAEARRQVCTLSCTQQCAAFRAGKVDHEDPRASCPRVGWILQWGCYGDCRNQATQRPPALTLGAKARNLAAALTRWARARFPLADRWQRRRRRAACLACDAWRPTGNLGFGECSDPRCGCTKLKRWLATETCPRGKWPR